MPKIASKLLTYVCLYEIYVVASSQKLSTIDIECPDHHYVDEPSDFEIKSAHVLI